MSKLFFTLFIVFAFAALCTSAPADNSDTADDIAPVGEVLPGDDEGKFEKS